MLTDSVVGIHLSGDFKTAMVGRQAKTNDTVIRSAEGRNAEGAGDGRLPRSPKSTAYWPSTAPAVAVSWTTTKRNSGQCKKSLGKSLPLFGCYCAGEIGPVDIETEKKGQIGGDGWHVMFTVIYK